jgi:hypothetical protein
MNNRFSLRIALAGAVLAAALAPFASTAASAAQGFSTIRQFRQPLAQADSFDAKAPALLFVGDNANNQISVFDANSKTQSPKPIRVIKSGLNGPQGLTTDRKGNLYVANLYNNTVTIYGPGASSPKATLSQSLSTPVDVKVDGAGNVYVANDPGLGNPSFIVEYAAGGSSPIAAWNFPYGGPAVSSLTLLNPTTSPSIYAAYYTLNSQDFATGGIASCYPGNSTCIMNIGPTLGQTGGITVEQSPTGNNPFTYLVVDQYLPGVDTFQPSTSPTSPIAQLVTGGTPEFLTLNATRTRLFVADRFYGRVTSYSSPSGTIVNQFYPAGGGENPQVYGVAVTPAGTYH